MKTRDKKQGTTGPNNGSGTLKLREAELAVINSVQRGLAENKEMQQIYDTVGTQLVDIFDAQVVIIASFNHEEQTESFHYLFEDGEKHFPEKRPYNKTRQKLIETKKMVNITEGARSAADVVSGTEVPKSMVFVPLLAGDTVKGYVSLQNLDKEKAFSKSDIRLLHTLANSLSVALENARLFNEAEQRNAELAVINSVQEALVAEMSMQGIYNLVGDQIQELFDAQVVGINTFDLEQGLEHFKYAYENGKLIELEPRPLDALRKKLIEKKKIILINENLQETTEQITGERPEAVLGTDLPKSAIFVPMLAGRTVRGYVTLQNLNQEHAFTDYDVDMLQRMAYSVTVALESARVYQAERRRADEQKALLDTMADLSQKLELNQLLDSVLERTVSLLGVNGSELAIYHEDTRELEVVSSLNLGMDSVGTRLSLDEGAMGRVAATHESIIIPDYQNWEGRSDKYQKTTVRSVMGVPLIIGDKLVGALCSVHLDSTITFDDDDLRLLNMFTPLVATAIENARLFEAERQRADEQQALLDTMSDLSKKLDLNLLLDAVVERTVSLLGVTGGELAIYDESASELEVVSSLNLGMQSVGHRLKHNEGVMGKVAETKEALIIPDYQHWEGRSNKYEETTVRGVMGVPLLIGNKLVGVLCSIHLDSDRTFDHDDLRLVNLFAPLAATAIDNARLFDAERQRADEQRALLDTMSDLSQKLELDILLRSVIERASTLLNVTGGELSIYDPENKTLEIVSSLNLGMQSTGTKLSLGEGAMGRVAETREPIIIPDYQNWDGRSDKYQKTTVHGVMGVPLMISDKLVGVLCSVHLEPNRSFDETDLRLLNMFAPLAATAIDNAQLFDTTNRLLGEAERRATELKETQQQLVQQEKLASLGQLTAGIAHEIKNPLNFVNNFSDVSIELLQEIRDELSSLTNSEVSEEVGFILNDLEANLEKILEHGERADGIVKSMLLHSRGKNGELIPTDLNKLIDEYVKLAYHGMRAVNKSFNIDIQSDYDPDIGVLDMVAQDLSRAFLNIINNAMYAAYEYSMDVEARNPVITISTKDLGNKVQISIRDNGPGIPDDIREKIFEPFFTTKPTGEGTGLGLSMTYDIINLNGGTLEIESDPGEFSEFIITLPKDSSKRSGGSVA